MIVRRRIRLQLFTHQVMPQNEVNFSHEPAFVAFDRNAMSILNESKLLCKCSFKHFVLKDGSIFIFAHRIDQSAEVMSGIGNESQSLLQQGARWWINPLGVRAWRRHRRKQRQRQQDAC